MLFDVVCWRKCAWHTIFSSNTELRFLIPTKVNSKVLHSLLGVLSQLMVPMYESGTLMYYKLSNNFRPVRLSCGTVYYGEQWFYINCFSPCR